jgi:hypothetical protein
MKKLTLLIFFLSFSVNAQYVNGIPVSFLKTQFKYLSVLPFDKGLNPQLKYVKVFFGQIDGWEIDKKSIIYEDKLQEDKMVFRGDTSVLNFFYENGYRLHTASDESKIFILERID